MKGHIQWRLGRLPVRGDRQSAFSLVELLAVIAVIAILAALFLPALNQARQQAYYTACNANLEQISMAMKMFAADRGRYYPESGGKVYWGATDARTRQPGWMQQIAGYVSKTNVFHCPGNVQLPAASRGPFNYFNGCHAAYVAPGASAAVKYTDIFYPSHFVLGGDTAGTPCKGGAVKFDPLDADKNDSTQNCVGGAADPLVTVNWRVHRDGQILFFADGHCAWYAGYVPEEMTFDYAVITNWVPCR